MTFVFRGFFQLRVLLDGNRQESFHPGFVSCCLDFTSSLLDEKEREGGREGREGRKRRKEGKKEKKNDNKKPNRFVTCPGLEKDQCRVCLLTVWVTSCFVAGPSCAL